MSEKLNNSSDNFNGGPNDWENAPLSSQPNEDSEISEASAKTPKSSELESESQSESKFSKLLNSPIKKAVAAVAVATFAIGGYLAVRGVSDNKDGEGTSTSQVAEGNGSAKGGESEGVAKQEADFGPGYKTFEVVTDDGSKAKIGIHEEMQKDFKVHKTDNPASIFGLAENGSSSEKYLDLFIDDVSADRIRVNAGCVLSVGCSDQYITYRNDEDWNEVLSLAKEDPGYVDGQVELYNDAPTDLKRATFTLRSLNGGYSHRYLGVFKKNPDGNLIMDESGGALNVDPNTLVVVRIVIEDDTSDNTEFDKVIDSIKVQFE